MHRVRLVAAASALLLLAGCARPVSDATQDLQPLDVSPTTVAVKSEPNSHATERRVFDHGLVVTVSPPRSFTPTDTAYPRSPRAAAFDLLIDNEGAEVYQPSQLSVSATCNGDTALQVIDSTQGYTGLIGATKDVPPGGHLRITVAFAVPPDWAEVALLVQPDAQRGGRVTMYEGGV
ncbi:MAG: hypothetical protein ACJ72N_22905 [Labedaea sp.]